MTAPYKICPRCQTPAALEATVCHQCGRQYRTQFVPPQAASAPADTPASAPARFAPPQSRMATGLTMAGAALLTFVVVLFAALSMQRRPAVTPDTSSTSAPAASSATSPIPSNPAVSPDTTAPPALSSDPVTAEAQKAVEKANRQLGLPPPSGSVDKQGRIHLKSGGTISKEEWEAARRKVEQSPLLGNQTSVPRL